MRHCQIAGRTLAKRSISFQGHLHRTALTPSKWRGADERALAELSAAGSCKAFEKEYLRKDGIRVPVLVGAATLGGGQHQGVAFVLDLTGVRRRRRTCGRASGSTAKRKRNSLMSRA
jgi:hypothetical protein